MSLPAAKELRARAVRVHERAALAGRPRDRFLRERRRRVFFRLVPILAMGAVATGVSALADLFRASNASRLVPLAQGITAITLAALALAVLALRKSLAAQLAIGAVGFLVLAVGWAIVTRLTGGIASPYTLAIPLGLTVFAMGVPFPPPVIPALAAASAGAMALSAPGAPPSAYVIFLLLGSAGYAMARARKKEALRAFRRVEKLAAALARMRKVQEQLVVVEKLEALRVLVGGIAHELNNALAVSLASVDQAKRDPANAAAAAERAERGLVRIRSTIERLRRFALADEGVLEPADLGAMLDFALESAVGRARSGVQIERTYDASIGPVETHVTLLAEALFQVAKNAVESMPKGGTIHAQLRSQGAEVVLAVADEGIGIPPARLAKVFDPFYARDAMDTHSGRVLPPLSGRSGLGLSAVYGIVTAIGGKLEIKSEVGKGTEVSIALPRKGRG